MQVSIALIIGFLAFCSSDSASPFVTVPGDYERLVFSMFYVSFQAVPDQRCPPSFEGKPTAKITHGAGEQVPGKSTSRSPKVLESDEFLKSSGQIDMNSRSAVECTTSAGKGKQAIPRNGLSGRDPTSITASIDSLPVDVA